MVEVTVGQQDQSHVACRLGDRVEVGVDLRPRVDHDRALGVRLAEHPGVGAVEGHDVWIRGEHTPRPLTERTARPGHHWIRPATSWASRTSRSAIERYAASPSMTASGSI